VLSNPQLELPGAPVLKTNFRLCAKALVRIVH
jgi:hypothetical protein